MTGRCTKKGKGWWRQVIVMFSSSVPRLEIHPEKTLHRTGMAVTACDDPLPSETTRTISNQMIQ